MPRRKSPEAPKAAQPPADTQASLNTRLAILCVFLNTGNTFTFRNVAVIHDNEFAIEFSYVAMSDGQLKVARFFKKNVAGISITR